jgi:hypothetical protein
MDTADTSAGESEHEDTAEVISAAELAGEEGGFSCSTIVNGNFTLTLFLILLVVFKGMRK